MPYMNSTPHDNQFAKRVLERIADEKLTPRPRWEFLFQNYVFCGLGAVPVALGSFAFSAMLYEIENVDWRLALVTHGSFFAFFLDVAPFLWIGALILFITLGYANVRRTNHGYRYSLSLIALGAILTSLSLGTALYATGFGGLVEELGAPFHRPILAEEHAWGLAPGKGLLGGQVVSATPGVASFVLRDFNGVAWTVDGSDLRMPDLAVVARGGPVRIVGVPVPGGVPATATSSVFPACFVLPWETHGDFRHDAVQFPLTGVASTSERNPLIGRSEACKGIRPYAQLRMIDAAGL